ncbi:hypothetical protein JN11_01216 [Mucilaginibacter frigoritolerans]|jgi:hypothetical protein|uniref:Uncharacterized protein n=1 Tax=Mucilaginibacter frigoritolerans TaxID=652788 RepID=A0A562U907_9SPHI|nr:hypothetical protein [Mucilaginibacter frigoritolerans]TWJ02244.1 hypothetical protein JN11_01216 [Mucilaginibacter frigoritolerans]
MTTRYKRFLIWFTRFGKVKARIIHFVFLCIAYFVFLLVLDYVLGITKHTSFNKEWRNSISFSLFFFVCAPFVSWRFYDVALIQLKEYRALAKKGLTRADLSRISFVRTWEHKRRKGIAVYCFFEGGLVLGMFLLFPVSLLLFLSLKQYNPMYYTFAMIGISITKNILLSFTIGLIIFRFRWSYNQRRFKRLTNPVT